MDEHLNRALFIGVSIVLLIAAMTAFIEGFEKNEEYLEKAIGVSSQDYLYRQGSAPKHSLCASGGEVIHLVLEKNRQDKDVEIMGIFGSASQEDSYERLPFIFVDGAGYEHVNLEQIESTDLFDISYTTNTDGIITAVEFNRR